MADKAGRRKWKDRQRRLNHWTKKYLDGVAPLIVDGDPGFATRRRIMTVKFYLGYGKNRGGEFTTEFSRRMMHPRSRKVSTLTMIATGIARRLRQKQLERKKLTGPGFATFDGKTVMKWMVPYLEEARRKGWKGVVVSGVRTPAYSVHLCFGICGRSFCPGKCAGLASNHNALPTQGRPFGALDVSDYVRFGQIQREIGSPLHNALGAQDPVHFSVSGR